MLLNEAETGREYIIKDIKTDDTELNDFLFSLGCYKGEKILLISRNSSGCVISIKNSRYNIDNLLASTITV